METENNNKKGRRRWGLSSILLLCVFGAMFVAGIVMFVRQFVFVPEPYTPPPISTPTPAATATPEQPPTHGIGFDPVTPSPTPYVQLIPVMMYFPDREVSCEIQPVGRIEEGEKAGKMDTIDSATIAAWYQYGPSPGEAGNSLINGHVRWKGKAGTFSILPELQPGERLIIEYDDGSTSEFYVDHTEYYSIYDVPASVTDLDIGGDPRISLISCTGDFDHELGTSSERVIVICTP